MKNILESLAKSFPCLQKTAFGEISFVLDLSANTLSLLLFSYRPKNQEHLFHFSPSYSFLSRTSQHSNIQNSLYHFPLFLTYTGSLSQILSILTHCLNHRSLETLSRKDLLITFPAFQQNFTIRTKFLHSIRKSIELHDSRTINDALSGRGHKEASSISHFDK